MREAERIATYELVGKFIMYQIAIAISSGGGEAAFALIYQSFHLFPPIYHSFALVYPFSTYVIQYIFF